MLRFLECGVADVDLALLAPESGLWLLVFGILGIAQGQISDTLTADFQYSAILTPIRCVVEMVVVVSRATAMNVTVPIGFSPLGHPIL